MKSEARLRPDKFKRRAMAFLRAARPAGREWTVEEAAVYAARRDYELLKLLSGDKKALRTARVLGVQLGGQQHTPHLQHAAAHTAAATLEQPAASGTEETRQPRKRRPPNAARRQKQRERSRQKRLTTKLLAVLPIVRKWAQEQATADAEMPAASPPPSPPSSACGSSTEGSGGSAAMQQQRLRSYAAAARTAIIAKQPDVSQQKRRALALKYDLLRAGVVSQSELTKSGSDAGSGALDAARLACFDACCMRLVQSPTKYHLSAAWALSLRQGPYGERGHPCAACSCGVFLEMNADALSLMMAKICSAMIAKPKASA